MSIALVSQIPALISSLIFLYTSLNRALARVAQKMTHPRPRLRRRFLDLFRSLSEARVAGFLVFRVYRSILYVGRSWLGIPLRG